MSPPRLILYTAAALLLLCPAPAVSERGGRGRWDHHPAPAPRTTPAPPPPSRSPRAWQHSLGWSVAPERCQIPAPQRANMDSYYLDYVSELLVQDKTLVSPIVFEGAMVSRTNTYKNLYFVSFKVFRVLKGKIHQQLHGHLRLLFQTESRRKSHNRKGPGGCPPIPFNVRSGRRYLVFVRELATRPGRYLATAAPDTLRRKSVREAKQMLNCRYCGKIIQHTTFKQLHICISASAIKESLLTHNS